VRGPDVDGHAHIGSAVSAGAVAVVCEDTSSVPAGVPCAVVNDTREALGRLAQAAVGWPVRRLVNVAVTGTNGKTTVTRLIREILSAAGRPCGSVGTIGYDTGRQSLPAVTTTPGAVELAALAADMVAAGRTHLVMETSSHALDQRRTAGINFQVAVLTNVSGDHIDYHKTMSAYVAAKRQLFEALRPGAAAVINRDDALADQFARATKARVRWYGLDAGAELRGKVERMDATGTDFCMSAGDEEVAVTTALIGRHNVSNCLAAAGAAAALGVDLATIAAATARVRCVPGRLELVDADAPYKVFVDYAHTDDALANVLGSLAPIAAGAKLIVVFGCGGDRDRTKRPRMAEVAQKHASHIVVTSDNPRSEEPGAIIDEILTGLDASGRSKTQVEPDRRSGIELAVSMAAGGDVVLIAGKGHETYQVIGERRIHFDDVEVAREAIARREQRR